MGGVIYSPRLGTPRFFRLAVSREFIAFWTECHTKGTVIGQGEILPVVLSKSTWAQALRHAKVIFWIDNDSARHCLIKGSGRSEASDVLAGTSSSLDSELECFSWYERVPSPSNPGDACSRLQSEVCLGRGWMEDQVVWPRLWDGRNLRPE